MTPAQRMRDLYDVLSRGTAWREWFPPPQPKGAAQKGNKVIPSSRRDPEMVERVLKHLKVHGSCSVSDIATATGYDWHRIRRALVHLAKGGVVESFGAETGRRWTLSD